VEASKLEESQILPVLERFYERVRRDPLLGPVFVVVADWPEHLQRLTEFWSSLMLTSGKYKGNPVAMHLIHAEKIRPEMFARWLVIWRETTDEMLPSVVAKEMQIKAGRIASRLNLALTGELIEFRAEKSVVPALRPYKMTKIFDEKSVPKSLLESHRVKSGAWALVRVLAGGMRLVTGETVSLLDPNCIGSIQPEVEHHLELHGPVQFQIEFFDHDPLQIHSPIHSVERTEHA
jgi:hemoglobin